MNTDGGIGALEVGAALPLPVPAAPAAAAPDRARRPGFDYAIDNLRGIAIVCVILSHCRSLNYLGAELPALWLCIAGATSWFLFISGYLFEVTERKRFHYGPYLQRKARNVLAPYLVIQGSAIVLGLLQQQYRLYGLDPLPYAGWMLVVGGARIGPLWFIPMIVLFFLAAPLVMQLSRRQWTLVAGTVLALALTFTTSRSHGNRNPMLSFVHFAGFYLFGVLVARHRATVRQWAQGPHGPAWIAAMLLGFALSAATVGTLDLAKGSFYASFGQPSSFEVGKLTLLVALLVALQRWMDRPVPVLARLADISFGLFFVHGVLLAVAAKLITALAIDAPAVQALLEVGLAIFGSIAVVRGVRRVAGRWSRYVVAC